MQLEADSDSQLSKGLCAVMVEALNGQQVQDVLRVSPLLYLVVCQAYICYTLTVVMGSRRSPTEKEKCVSFRPAFRNLD